MPNEENDKKQAESFKKAEIINEDGLKISYDPKELEKNFPSLMIEISEKKKYMRIESVNHKLEQKVNIITNNICYQENLNNPGAIDFIRRCTNNEDAIEILDFLFNKKEISDKDYKFLKSQILKEGGLKKLINDSGGLKTPGYYIRKYYHKKNITHSKLDKSNNLD